MRHIVRLLLVPFLWTSYVSAAPPKGFTENIVMESLRQPTSFALSPSGDVFVTEKSGSVVFRSTTGVTKRIQSLDVDTQGERGLLGIALSENFEKDALVYLYLTNPTLGRNQIITYQFRPTGLTNGKTIFNLDPLSATNHNGGHMKMHQGFLYFTHGENARPQEAQSLNNMLGKLGRILPDGSIPNDNPYINQNGNGKAIWATGLRNPFSFAIHREDGVIYVNDVGQDSYEEINQISKGRNYAWPFCEGPCSSRYTNPVLAYDHSSGCAITGGAFYDAPKSATKRWSSTYDLSYFFGDYCGGWIRRFDRQTGQALNFITGLKGPIDIVTHPNGDLYVLCYGDGTLRSYSTVSQRTVPPQVSLTPKNVVSMLNQTVKFTCSVLKGVPDPVLSWYVNDQLIATHTSDFKYTSSYSRKYNITCRANNSVGTDFDRTSLTYVPVRRPWLKIESPESTFRYETGSNIILRGIGYDGNGTRLNEKDLFWDGVFHHDDHTHPWFDTKNGGQVTVEIPKYGETSRHVYYQIMLKAKSKYGLESSISRTIRPLPIRMYWQPLKFAEAQWRSGGKTNGLFWELNVNEYVGDTFYLPNGSYTLRIKGNTQGAARSLGIRIQREPNMINKQSQAILSGIVTVFEFSLDVAISDEYKIEVECSGIVLLDTIQIVKKTITSQKPTATKKSKTTTRVTTTKSKLYPQAKTTQLTNTKSYPQARTTQVTSTKSKTLNTTTRPKITSTKSKTLNATTRPNSTTRKSTITSHAIRSTSMFKSLE